jgi:uncharacterized membrane protein
MIRFGAEQTISRSADAVWTYAADVLRHPEWMAVTDARILRGTGMEIGDRGREHLLFGPFRWDVEFEVLEAEPGRRIVWRSVAGAPFELDVALDLEPIGPTSTRAIYAAAIRLRGLWRMLSPLVAIEGRAGQARELRRLKERVEAAAVLAEAAS